MLPEWAELSDVTGRPLIDLLLKSPLLDETKFPEYATRLAKALWSHDGMIGRLITARLTDYKPHDNARMNGTGIGGGVLAEFKAEIDHVVHNKFDKAQCDEGHFYGKVPTGARPSPCAVAVVDCPPAR